MLAPENGGQQGVNQQERILSMASNASVSTSNNHQRSYSNIVKSANQHYTFPTKDQAILLNAIDEFKLSDYVIAVGNIIGPKNILFASRIANNRICIYLKNVNLVNQIVAQHNTIEINNVPIDIRRLVTPAKRIIISNVSPIIPHEIISNVLQNFGLQLVSQITFLRAGIQEAEYNHVLSFRRQAYVAPPENEMYELPSTTVVNFEDTPYRIFLTFDEAACFICKKSGHVAKSCPNIENSGNQTGRPLIQLEVEDTNDKQYTPQEGTLRKNKRPLPSSIASTNTETEKHKEIKI